MLDGSLPVRDRLSQCGARGAPQADVRGLRKRLRLYQTRRGGPLQAPFRAGKSANWRQERRTIGNGYPDRIKRVPRSELDSGSRPPGATTRNDELRHSAKAGIPRGGRMRLFLTYEPRPGLNGSPRGDRILGLAAGPDSAGMTDSVIPAEAGIQ